MIVTSQRVRLKTHCPMCSKEQEVFTIFIMLSDFAKAEYICERCGLPSALNLNRKQFVQTAYREEN